VPVLHDHVIVPTLGACRYPAPLQATVPEAARVPAEILQAGEGAVDADGESFELAGPRPRLFFDPARTRAGIVTCGGLCPGLNNVIRSLFLALRYTYGVPEVLGFCGGYRGLDPRHGGEPFVLTPERVRDIHHLGGTILGTSRGPVDVAVAIEHLMRRQVNVLLAVGGDGTQRGAHALHREAARRGYPLAVVGVPKTIDNDICFVSRTFGYLTAVEEAARVLAGAHAEAHSVANGISLVKLMGRQAGFIAAGAAIASQDVNFVLVPEVPFVLEGPHGFLAALERRVRARGHAVVVVAEGAGQDLLGTDPTARDASGNPILGDIGPVLRARIAAHCASVALPVVLRYFDPSYVIRSRPANAEDAILCDFYARHAVHAAMAGKTDLVIGLVHDVFVHVPIALLLERQPKRLAPEGMIWQGVLATTGQPARFA